MASGLYKKIYTILKGTDVGLSIFPQWCKGKMWNNKPTVEAGYVENLKLRKVFHFNGIEFNRRERLKEL